MFISIFLLRWLSHLPPFHVSKKLYFSAFPGLLHAFINAHMQVSSSRNKASAIVSAVGPLALYTEL